LGFCIDQDWGGNFLGLKRAGLRNNFAFLFLCFLCLHFGEADLRNILFFTLVVVIIRSLRLGLILAIVLYIIEDLGAGTFI
jgi:hypothetical protein